MFELLEMFIDKVVAFIDVAIVVGGAYLLWDYIKSKK